MTTVRMFKEFGCRFNLEGNCKQPEISISSKGKCFNFRHNKKWFAPRYSKDVRK